MRENDASRKSRSHLQMSVCYHIGFVILPDDSRALFHLGESAAHGNAIAIAMQQPVQAALLDHLPCPTVPVRICEGRRNIAPYMNRVRHTVLARSSAPLASNACRHNDTSIR